MQTVFQYEFRVAERRAGARLLRRVLYPGPGRSLEAIVLIGPVALAGVAIVGRYQGWWDETGQFVGLVAAFLAVILLRLGVRRLARSPSATPASVQANEGRKVSFAFSDEGYRMTSEYFEAFQRWPGVHRIVSDGELILFVIADMAHILPARSFASGEDRAAFLQWALDRLTPEARARSETDKISHAS